MQVIKYAFQQHGDERGMLVALEEQKDIPFEIKRVYYLYDTKTEVHRGFHAHKSLEQILICIHGSCKVLLDNGTEKKVVSLEKPYEGLYVPNDMWREMYDFSEDAVLLVLASDYYIEEDYIRDYKEFQQYKSTVQKIPGGGELLTANGKSIEAPFEVQRVFYIYGSDQTVIRGRHANRNSEFLLINVCGSSKVRVDDGMGNETVVVLDGPATGLYLPTMVWKDMYDFSEDAVLLVLASEHYDSEEYIRDYEEFQQIVRKGRT